jgi:hypothetical protein
VGYHFASSKGLIPAMDFDQLLRSIKSRTAESGGYSHKPGGPYRADATAWAIMALSGSPAESEALKSGCDHLAGTQAPDGRIPLIPEIAAAYWPTPIAVLAWKKSSCRQGEMERALSFIAGNSGLHFEREKNSPSGHNTAIRGWSWIEGTHSWIEPTTMAILALRANRLAQHGRTLEAVSMVMDRQLPSGGWNYGNTTVFGQELLPMPEHTGQALCAVSGYVAMREVRKSIEYIRQQRPHLKTPLSLCWSLFGLKAWGMDLPGLPEQISNCLSLQDRYGIYDTTSLAQLAIAFASGADLLDYLGIES